MSLPPEPTADACRLWGWWKLCSSEVEFQTSGRRIAMYDAPATGYIVFADSGWMMTIVEVCRADGPADTLEHAPGYRGMAYCGRYELDAGRWRTTVDAASIDGWAGSVQERTYRIDGERLYVCSAWCVSRLHADQNVRAWLVWERLA